MTSNDPPDIFKRAALENYLCNDTINAELYDQIMGMTDEEWQRRIDAQEIAVWEKYADDPLDDIRHYLFTEANYNWLVAVEYIHSLTEKELQEIRYADQTAG